MKKLFLSLSLLFFAVQGFSQLFKTVKIDTLVSVSLPATYQEKDTLNRKVFSGKGAFGYMMVIRIANAGNNAALKKEKDLKKVFQDYMNDVQQQSGASGQIINMGDTTVGTLKAKVFTLQTNDDQSSNLQLIKFIYIYTRDATYSFEYFYKDATAFLIKDELKTFTSSIKLSPDLQRDDQYTFMGKSGMSPILLYSLIGGGVVLVIIIIVVIVRSRKRRNR